MKNYVKKYSEYYHWNEKTFILEIGDIRSVAPSSD
jgi:hypothetical protein